MLYVGSVIYRITITTRSLRNPSLIVVSEEDACAFPDDDLPVYTVLVPIYDEAAVLPELVGQLRGLEYPRDLLDVQLLVEAGDVETVEAALTHAGDDIHVVVVPESNPRTKPKALNFGLTLTEGDFVTIYDAEDRPEPLQLRRAVVAFSRLPPDVGCLQAQLADWNTDQNLLTRWFSIEYIQCFQLLLPGLAASDAPVPLGGTSNHIRTELLEAIGGWDPYNVTEDADLGVRLHRGGLPVGGARVDHTRGSELRLRQLEQPTIALVQGLYPDVAGAHASPGASGRRARMARLRGVQRVRRRYAVSSRR